MRTSFLLILTNVMSFKAYYSKHFERRSKEVSPAAVDDHQPIIQESLPQTITNKLRNKISFGSTTAEPQQQQQQQQTHDQGHSPTSSTSYSIFKRTAKLKKLNSSLSVDKRSRYETSTNTNTSTNNYTQKSNAGAVSGNDSSTSSNSVDLSPLVMMTSPVPAQSNTPIVQQPHFVLNNNGKINAGGDLSTCSSTSSNCVQSAVTSHTSKHSFMSFFSKTELNSENY